LILRDLLREFFKRNFATSEGWSGRLAHEPVRR
jgi:hypothetical protein